MSKSGFLSGLIGVAVGALLATLFGAGRLDSNASPPRSDTAGVERAIERAIARWETVLLERTRDRSAADGNRREADKEGAREHDAPAPSNGERRLAVSGPDDAPSRIHPARVREIAGHATKLEALQRIKKTDSTLLVKTYMLWSYRDVVREFGRPTMTSITKTHPTFQYSFKDPAGIGHVIQFVFIDGVVFHVTAW